MSTEPGSTGAVRDGNAIVDNRARTVGDFLRARLGIDAALSVVSAYFTIYAYGDLRVELEGLRRLRFLYGQPEGAASVDPAEGEDKAYRLTRDGTLELRRALTQKPLARACAQWIKEKVDVRTVRKANFLHGKLYHVKGTDGATAALLGSSNFTRGGLGLGANPNIELNIQACPPVLYPGDRYPVSFGWLVGGAPVAGAAWLAATLLLRRGSLRSW